MIATKAVATILMTGLGSLAAGTAAYLDNANPRAYVREPSHQPPAPVPPAKPLVVKAPEPRAVEAEMVSIDPVVITTRPQHRHKVAAVKAPAAQHACSEWQDLATGPAGRQVRMLCP